MKKRKQIDIVESDFIPLSILAVKAGTNLKNYIEGLLSKHVKENTL